MKRIVVVILSLLSALSSRAINYYVSSIDGLDTDNGLTQGTAWRTMYKLNSMRATIKLGDSVLFQRGGTYRGYFIAVNSGSLASPIVFGAYGTGARPLITGFCGFGTWTVVSGNIWQAQPDSTLKSYCNILTFNAIPQAVGRTPWFTYQSASATQLTSSTLTGTPSYVGAEVVMKKNAFVSEKGTVTAQTGSTITYTNNTQPINNNSRSPFQAGRPNYGFFFQRGAGFLDLQGEWYFNQSTNRMQIYSTTNPNSATIQATYVDTIFLLSNKQNYTFDNLDIEGANQYGIEAYSTSGITIKNCTFNNNTLPIYMWTTADPTVSNNLILNSFYVAININGNSSTPSKRITITNNVIRSVGQLVGNGVYNNEHALRGIVAKTDASTAGNFVNIIGNTINLVGNGAIHFQGSNVLIRRNWADSFCNQLQDNGGIYSFVNTTSTNAVMFVNRIIDSNFVSHAIGSPIGENGNIDVTGIYNDDQVLNIIIKDNVIWEIPGNGIQLNDPLNMEVYNNTLYSDSFPIAIQRYGFGNITGNRITRNVIYQKRITHWNFIHVNNNLSRSPAQTQQQSLANMAFIDSNWISNMQTLSGYKHYYSALGDGNYNPVPTPLNLTQWRASPYFHDVHSAIPPVPLTATNSALYTNYSYTPLTVFFSGLSKVSPKGVVYNHSATIGAYSGLILIDNGNAQGANKKPVANAGPDQTLTLPQNSTTLAGSAIDSDGVITGYKWIQLPGGPNTATFSTTNITNPIVSNLVPGTYQFQLTAYDNGGDSGKSIMRIIVGQAPNQPPTVNAGTNVILVLPANSTTLTADTADADGYIVSISWVKFSGGVGGTIASPTSKSTAINGLQQGVYQYQVTVTDNRGGTAQDVVQITVNPGPNQPPAAGAGVDKVITLPVNSVSLTGTASDADGTFTILWTKFSGGIGGTITGSTTTTPTINNLQQGTYQYDITVTDNDGAITSDRMTITVNAPIIVNQPPTAFAGTDSTVVLPKSTSTLVGYGLDPEDTIMFSFHWRKLPGSQSGGAITNPDSASTPITGLIQGFYQYELTVTDSAGAQSTDIVSVTVNPAPNLPPTSNAGPDQPITLPVNQVTMAGSGTDPENSISTHVWTKISGPSTFTITNANSYTTTITGLVEGTYHFQLTITDAGGLVAIDEMTVVVSPAIPPANNPPTAFSGGNKNITAPTATVTLVGSGFDTDGTVDFYSWTKIGGPGSFTILTPSASTTVINNLVPGTYQFLLTVTDNDGATGNAVALVTVNAQPANINPTVVINGGNNVNITLPVNTATLTGVATDQDQDGFIVLYSWIKTSGPAGGTIVSPAAATTDLTGLPQGVSTYELTATDDRGGTGKNTITVTVLPPIIANVNPVADAGGDKIITAPANSTSVTGTASDADGTVTRVEWRKISGPPGGNLSAPTSLTTSITQLQVGVYQYDFIATDNDSATATSTMHVTVNPQPANINPVVGTIRPDTTIVLPVSTVALSGAATDADGTVSSYVWSQTSGPGTATLTTPNAQTTNATGLIEGIYIFQLLATDNSGGIGINTVTITVLHAVVLQRPVAQAGSSRQITLPKDSVHLLGAGTDADGTIEVYLWEFVSGPLLGGGNISSPDSAATSITQLLEGTYVYRLTVTDNDGLIGTSLIQIIVLPVPDTSSKLIYKYLFVPN